MSLLALPKRFRAPEVVAVLEDLRRRGESDPLTLDFGAVEEFDSSTLAFIHYVRGRGSELKAVNIGGALARAEEGFLRTPDREETPVSPEDGWLARRLNAVADRFLRQVRSLGRFLAMFGDEVYHLGTFLKERKGVYPGETWNQLFFMGYRSFPIITMLLFLVGVTISITSANQLKIFGAEVYLADLVGYAMLRELVPLMVGVILAGKVGAAVTAELASMSVLEEVDALKTMGVVPERFLMVPRLLAITLAVPLLVALADVVIILGGVVVARVMFRMTPSA